MRLTAISGPRVIAPGTVDVALHGLPVVVLQAPDNRPLRIDEFLATVAHFLNAGEAFSAERVSGSGCQGDPHDGAIHTEESR